MLTFLLCINRMPFDKYVKWLLCEAARHGEVKTKLLEWRNGIFSDRENADAYIRSMMYWQEIAELADTTHWTSASNTSLAFNRFVAQQGADIWYLRTKRILVMIPHWSTVRNAAKRARLLDEAARQFYLV